MDARSEGVVLVLNRGRTGHIVMDGVKRQKEKTFSLKRLKHDLISDDVEDLASLSEQE